MPIFPRCPFFVDCTSGAHGINVCQIRHLQMASPCLGYRVRISTTFTCQVLLGGDCKHFITSDLSPLCIWYYLVKVRTKIDVDGNWSGTYRMCASFYNNGSQKVIGKLQQHMNIIILIYEKVTALLGSIINIKSLISMCTGITHGSPPRNRWWRLW